MKPIFRVVACFCAMAIAIGATAFSTVADTDGKISDITAPIDTNVRFAYDSVQPNTVLEYPLTADMFTWTGTIGLSGNAVTTAQLRAANVAVKYSTNQSKIIEEISFGTTTYNGHTTACVKVEFVEEYVSVDSLEFRLTLYLTIGNNRKEASSCRVYGTFENEEVVIDSGYDYINLADGKVLRPSDYIENLEIDLGDGVQVFTRVYKDRKYYATAQNRILDKDDGIITANPGIERVVRLTTINLNPGGKCVSLSDIGDYYIYNSLGAYLGTTDERVAFSDLYYLSSDKISFSGTSGGGSGSGTSDSGGTSIDDFGLSDDEASAKSEMAGATERAIAAGLDTASIHVQNVESISADELAAMHSAATAAGLKAGYIADTMNMTGSAVQGRIAINPALAVNMSGDIQLGVYTSTSITRSTTERFEKHFDNRIKVVSMAHPGSYSMTVSIAARISTADMDRSNLCFYTYDRLHNRYERIVDPKYHVDSGGYLHFVTIYGNDIVVSEGPLKQK